MPSIALRRKDCRFPSAPMSLNRPEGSGDFKGRGSGAPSVLKTDCVASVRRQALWEKLSEAVAPSRLFPLARLTSAHPANADERLVL